MGKILILCNHEIVVTNFKEELFEELLQKNEVFLSMPLSEEDIQVFSAKGFHCINTEIERRGKNVFKDLFLVKNYFSMMRSIQPDLVFSLTIKPSIYGGFIARLLNIQMISNVTGIGTAFQGKTWLKRFVTMLYRISFKKVHTVFFENGENLDLFVRLGILDRKNTSLVAGSGVNLQKFQPKPYPEHEVMISYVGRIMKEKGIEEFLYAAKENHTDAVTFKIYGFCEENYIQTLKAYEEQGYIVYGGFTNQIQAVYESSSCIVLPSYHEGMSNVILEAAATARPVVTTNISGCREAVVDGVSGFLAVKEDSIDLSEKVRKFISLSWQERRQMGIAGRKHVEDHFDRADVNRTYMKVISEILQKK